VVCVAESAARAVIDIEAGQRGFLLIGKDISLNKHTESGRNE
jgi:CHASE3 domain sensor protein